MWELKPLSTPLNDMVPILITRPIFSSSSFLFPLCSYTYSKTSPLLSACLRTEHYTAHRTHQSQHSTSNRQSSLALHLIDKTAHVARHDQHEHAHSTNILSANDMLTTQRAADICWRGGTASESWWSKHLSLQVVETPTIAPCRAPRQSCLPANT